MSDGIYAAAAGMAAQSARIDAISNDVANVDTNAYKTVRTGFRDLVYTPELGVSIGSGAAAVDFGRDFTQGPLGLVDDPLSLGIEGPGFFQVRRPDGTAALTRDGGFRLDSSRNLVTGSGEQLVPPITLPDGTSPADVSIAADGTVTAKGKAIGKIQLVDVPAPASLQSDGNGLFLPTTGSGAVTNATTGQIRQSTIEGSNVDMAVAMTAMVDAQRGYQLASKAIQTQDQLLEIANGIRR